MGVEYNTLCLGVPAEKTSSRDIVNEVRFSRKCSKNGLFIFGKPCNYIVKLMHLLTRNEEDLEGTLTQA